MLPFPLCTCYTDICTYMHIFYGRAFVRMVVFLLVSLCDKRHTIFGSRVHESVPFVQSLRWQPWHPRNLCKRQAVAGSPQTFGSKCGSPQNLFGCVNIRPPPKKNKEILPLCLLVSLSRLSPQDHFGCQHVPSKAEKQSARPF